MRFLGEQDQFSRLKASQENSIDAILMNSFNAGFDAYDSIITQYHEQALSAINQGIDPHNLPNQNPFIDVLVRYLDSNTNNTATTN